MCGLDFFPLIIFSKIKIYVSDIVQFAYDKMASEMRLHNEQATRKLPIPAKETRKIIKKKITLWLRNTYQFKDC